MSRLSGVCCLALKLTRCLMRMAALHQSTTARVCPASVWSPGEKCWSHNPQEGHPIQCRICTEYKLSWQRVRLNLKFQEEFSRLIANFLHPVILLGDSGLVGVPSTVPDPFNDTNVIPSGRFSVLSEEMVIPIQETPSTLNLVPMGSQTPRQWRRWMEKAERQQRVVTTPGEMWTTWNEVLRIWHPRQEPCGQCSCLWMQSILKISSVDGPCDEERSQVSARPIPKCVARCPSGSVVTRRRKTRKRLEVVDGCSKNVLVQSPLLPRGGFVSKKKLTLRFEKFTRGEWLDLIFESAAPF